MCVCVNVYGCFVGVIMICLGLLYNVLGFNVGVFIICIGIYAFY